MEQKRKLKGIADLYAVDDARKSNPTGGTPVTPVTPVPPVRGDDIAPSKVVVDQKTSTFTNDRQSYKESQNQSAHTNSDTLKDTQSRGVTPVPPVKTSKRGVTGVTGVTPVGKYSPDSSKMGSGIAPQKDFTRVANSIVREAVPAGAFTGKGKQLYDYLYSQTRGAIVPSISARIPSDKVMAGAGMSRKTLRFHLERLRHEGLIDVEEITGAHGGNIYTVYLPEEIKAKGGNPGTPGNPGYTGEKLQGVQGLESNPGYRGVNEKDSTTYEADKTSFKTDDEDNDETHTLMEFARMLERAAREVCVGELNFSEKEKERWRELAELLAGELVFAGKRAGVVSSAPAFFAAHLRRSFAQEGRRQPTQKQRRSSTPEGSGGGEKASSSSSSSARAEAADLTARGVVEEAGRSASPRPPQQWQEEEEAPRDEPNGVGVRRRPGEQSLNRQDGSQYAFEERKFYAQNQRPPLGGGWLVESGTGKYDELIGDWLGERESAKTPAAAEKRADQGPKKQHRLTPEDISERGQIIGELIESGYTIEQAEKQFGSGLHPDDWEGILSNMRTK